MDVLLDYFLHVDRHLAELAQSYGAWIYAILFGVVFAETGLVVTPFLPGDSLLFAAGALAGTGVLDITTVGVKMVQPEMVLSDATRLALTGLAKSLSLEHARDNILVNSLCPGPIATDRFTDLIEATKARRGLGKAEAEQVWLQEVPLARAGLPRDFGDLVAVLASEVASFVTGQAIAVDGCKSRAY